MEVTSSVGILVTRCLRHAPRMGRTLCVFVMAVATACIAERRPPEVAPSGTLSIDPRESATDAPFAVVFAGPRGEARAGARISVVFNRPLRELSPETETTPPVSLSPSIPGAWQWVGSAALSFVPESGGLPGATEFVVAVPAATRALDGSTLGRPHRFEFSTPRPLLVESTPSQGQRRLLPKTKIELRFNQPIDPARLAATAVLKAESHGTTKTIPFDVALPKKDQPKHLVVAPREPFPIHAQIRLSIDAGLTGTEGPLSAGKEQHVAFETYGPLGVETMSCDTDTPDRRCRPGTEVTLHFTNEVRGAAVKHALRIEPPLEPRFDSWIDDETWTSTVSFTASFAPSTEYRISVLPGLRDEFGQMLPRAFEHVLKTGDYWPRVEIGASGDYLEPSVATPVPVGSINVTRYGLAVAALGPADLVRYHALDGTKAAYDFVSKRKNDAWYQLERPRAPKNRTAHREVHPRTVLGKRNRGAFAIAVESPDPRRQGRRTHAARVIQLTDLAISAKISRHGSLVWVTRLSSGAPVAGADVELWDTGGKRGSYRTDAGGFATIPREHWAPNLEDYEHPTSAILVARHEGDWSYRRAVDYVGAWRYSVPTDLSGSGELHGMVFTERGLYRPGDEVHIKGILRRNVPGGNAVVSGKSFEVRLHSPEGDPMVKRSVATNEFGTFAFAARIPLTAPLGSYSVRSALPHGPLDASFQVAEYRPAEFKVTAESDRPAYVRNDRGRWTVRGDYLFGAPMAGADARYTLSYTPTDHSPPGTEGFSTSENIFFADDPQASFYGGALASNSAKLDARGTLAIEEKLSIPNQRGPALVVLDAEVTDVSRQAVAASTATVVHPADFYVGIRYPKESFVDVPGKVRAVVGAFTPEGRALAGKHISVELVSRRWSLVREVSGDSTRTVSKPIDRVVGTCRVVTNESRAAECTLPVTEGGYYLVHATATDARNRPVGAALGMYAIGAGGASWGDGDDRRIELALDKKTYREGETARVLVKSPFPEARALVTVERAGVYWKDQRTLKGPTPTIEIPVTKSFAPNAFVSVHLVRGRTGAKSAVGVDTGAPTYRTGFSEIRLDPTPHELVVSLTPNKTDFRPGETVTVDLAVHDAKKKPHRAEVTVFAADEGVLSLIGYKTPDPMKVFFEPRPLEVALLEARDSLARIALEDLALLGAAKGAEGGGGGDGARRDFRQSLYFNPSVVTDDRGRARVAFKLAESLTTFRIMAVAVTSDDRYGSGEARVTTSKPLMARPALPRFLRAGDRARAGVIVTSKDFPTANAVVTAHAEGVRLTGSKSKTVKLERNASVEVPFEYEATQAGPSKFKFYVAAAGARDAVEVTRSVQVPAVFEAVALYGKTDAESAERLGDLSSVRRDVGSLDIQLASSALVGLGGGVEQLVEFPYGCTEQLASRLLPLVPLRDLARTFSIPLPKDAATVVEQTVADLLARQSGDGGFRLWPESRESFPWVSGYTLFVLNEAKRRGTSVPRRVFERGTAYLRRELAKPDDDAASLATAALFVDVLASLGAPDDGYATRLFERRKDLPLFARALLLHALAQTRSGSDAARALRREIEGELRIDANVAYAAENAGDAYAVLMDSSARSSAMVLRALLAVEPNHALAARLARGLIAARQGGSWASTQEAAFALLALDDYRKAQEKAPPRFDAEVWLGEQSLARTEFSGHGAVSDRTTLPLSQLGAGNGLLTFEKRGSGTLFYEARLEYARKTLPTTALDRGFFVEKTLRTITPETLEEALATTAGSTVGEVPAGSLLLADVIVVTPSPRDYVVIDDPLPAGLEAVDLDLKTTAQWLTTEEAGPGEDYDTRRDELAAGNAFLEAWYRRELRDDRVLHFVDHLQAGMYRYRYIARATTRGSFVMPPTQISEMYTPEVHGRTGAARLEVR